MPDLAVVVAHASFFLTMALINAIICLGLNLQWGQTGLFNVGVAGFVAVGAYVSAILTTPASDGHLGGFSAPIVVGWLGAIVAAGAVSAFIVALTLRLRADYLAITTFGVAIIAQLIALNARSSPAAPSGSPSFRAPSRPGRSAGAVRLVNFALLAVVVAVLFLALERLVRSPWGRVLRAIREDERPRWRSARPGALPPRGLRDRRGDDGPRRRDRSAFHRLHRAGRLPADPHVPGLGDADRRRVGQQPRRDSRRFVVWVLWSASGLAISALVQPEFEARAAALRIVAIGVLLAAMIVLRPRGIFAERAIVSRFLDEEEGG